jgi:hypothetical protein
MALNQVGRRSDKDACRPIAPIPIPPPSLPRNPPLLSISTNQHPPQKTQDLVAAKVQLDGLSRRLALAERERDRAAATLNETRERLSEADGRLATVEGELATSRALEARLQGRLVGAKTAAEVRVCVVDWPSVDLNGWSTTHPVPQTICEKQKA